MIGRKMKYVVHSQDFHDNILMTFIEIFCNTKIDYDKLVILLPNGKYKRMIKFFDNLPAYQTKKIVIKCYKSRVKHNGNSFKRLWNQGIAIMNLIFVFYQIYNSKKVFFLDYGYSYLDDIALLSFSLRTSEVYINLHNIKFHNKLKKYHFRLYQNIKGFMVLSEVVKQKLSEETVKEIFVFPDLLPNRMFMNNRKATLSLFPQNKLKLVVIGNVTTKRRDYYTIIDSLSAIEEHLEIVFLGKAKDLNVINKAKSEFSNFRFFDHFINDEDFEAEMLYTNYIITWISNEQYTSNKISGNMYDAVRFGVPMISNMPNFSLKWNHNIVVDNPSELKLYLRNSISQNQWEADAIHAVEKAHSMNVSQIASDFQAYIEFSGLDG